ncbi:MAG TPA: tetratricopeptide repeat protein [Pyrinomonadaceae bacterium]|nr:tetratricopeptide repeat protein [Pyrinomonadaceae bacterium]
MIRMIRPTIFKPGVRRRHQGGSKIQQGGPTTHWFMRYVAATLILFVAVTSVLGTCGGGGGGGSGGMSGGSGGPSAPVYLVPWKIRKASDAAPQGLVLYWFPATENELRNSSLRESRILSLYAAKCIAMEVADGKVANAEKLVGGSQLPVAVLATADGNPINKVENKAGKLKVGDVEKVVDAEFKAREGSIETQIKDAAEKAKAGDSAGAVEIYKSVLEHKCMFPKKAKDAANQLKKLGVAVNVDVTQEPVFDRQKSAVIEQTMRRGLIAEIREQYRLAERLYRKAALMDPADPTPLRYLGETYRHHTGEWDKARVEFQKILDMPSDPLSRAVALHGLGKMTIHDGEFKKGLALFEQSIGEFPLPITYRNLAVYWNSEGDPAKGNEYTQKALALDPKDPYNIVFAAVFMAANGKKDEALKIARANMNLLPASYNLAAIYAQNGQRDKALSLLRRHFFRYERYQAVRAKEMMEARVDAVFESIRHDSEFMALTSGADGKLQMPMRNMNTGSQNQ